MLNWVAIYGGQWLFGLGGPLQDDEHAARRSRDTLPLSATYTRSGASIRAERARRRSSSRSARPSSTGWSSNRTTLGYEVRAVGLQPRGGALRRRLACSARSCSRWRIAGAFAGLAGAARRAGPARSRSRRRTSRSSTPASPGIAVALLGRNTASASCSAALLFAALTSGAQQHLERDSRPSSPIKLATIIQGVDHPVRRRRGRRCAGSSRAAAGAAARTSRRPLTLPRADRRRRPYERGCSPTAPRRGALAALAGDRARRRSRSSARCRRSRSRRASCRSCSALAAVGARAARDRAAASASSAATRVGRGIVGARARRS